jgi:hypothetical protein
MHVYVSSHLDASPFALVLVLVQGGWPDDVCTSSWVVAEYVDKLRTLITFLNRTFLTRTFLFYFSTFLSTFLFVLF